MKPLKTSVYGNKACHPVNITACLHVCKQAASASASASALAPPGKQARQLMFVKKLSTLNISIIGNPLIKQIISVSLG